jgi:hypothetical protein
MLETPVPTQTDVKPAGDVPCGPHTGNRLAVLVADDAVIYRHAAAGKPFDVRDAANRHQDEICRDQATVIQPHPRNLRRLLRLSARADAIAL